jgi:hypothetical protein
MRSLWIAMIGLWAMGLAAGLGGCKDEVTPCDEYERFAEEVGLAVCPGLDWDCETAYPDLTAERQQDLDWCLDCVRMRETSTGDASELDCSSAPLSEQDCGVLLDETLDASCFAARP